MQGDAVLRTNSCGKVLMITERCSQCYKKGNMVMNHLIGDAMHKTYPKGTFTKFLLRYKWD